MNPNKKFKKVKAGFVANSLHGFDDDYADYLRSISEYNLMLKGMKKSDKVIAKKTKKPEAKGWRFTLSAVVNLSDGNGYIGMSVCNPYDNFSKHFGVENSTDKAIVYTDNTGNIKSGDPIATFKIDNISKFKIETKYIPRFLVNDNKV